MSEISVSIKIDESLIRKAFNITGLSCNEDLFQVDSMVVSRKFNNTFIETIKNIDSTITENHYDIIKSRHFVRNIQILKINGVYIAKDWYDMYTDIFNYACLNIFNKCSKNDMIFKFTLFTPPVGYKLIILTHEVGKTMGVVSKSNKDPFIKEIYLKLKEQTKQKPFEEWFANGHFYQYADQVLMLNVTPSFTTTEKGDISEMKYWKLFIQKLLLKITNKDTTIYSVGKFTKDLISTMRLNCNIIEDLDPRVLNKPYNYVNTPDIFNTFNYIFEK